MQDWNDLRLFFSNFLWTDYCSLFVCTQGITEVTVFGMEVQIPCTSFTLIAIMPWFHHACSHVIKDRGAAHKWDLNLQAPAKHDLYLIHWNQAKFIFHLTQNSL